MNECDQPLRIDCATLRAFTLSIEEEVTNPGMQSDNEEDDKGNSAKKQKSERIPKKNNQHGGGGHNNNNKKVYTGRITIHCVLFLWNFWSY
jgi:hypothetical protein